MPYRAETSSLVYQAREVRDLLAAARAVDDPSDAFALVTALRSPLFGCGDDDLWTWKQAARLVQPPGTGSRTRVANHPVAAAIGVPAAAAPAGPVDDTERGARRAWSSDRRVLEIGGRTGARARDTWRRLRFVVDQARAWSEAEHGGLRAYLAWAARRATRPPASPRRCCPRPTPTPSAS